MNRIPLYAEAIEQTPDAQGHFGLYWERFFNGYPDKWDPDANQASKEAWTANKIEWLSKFDTKMVGDIDECEAACLRQRSLVDSLNGSSRVYQVEWRFLTGSGLPHPMENGFLWHPTLGTPYLPGSTVKGLLRSWIEAWASHHDDKNKWAQLYRWFGSEKKVSKNRQKLRNDNPEFHLPTQSSQGQPDTEAGSFIFFDALPPTRVRLKADVMTPHMGEWYKNGASDPSKPGNQPADWHSPNPIGFLTAEKPAFQFSIAPRPQTTNKEISELMDALHEALTWLGAGAKTAVGYGQMTENQVIEKRLQRTADSAKQEELQARQRKEELEAMNPVEREIHHLVVGSDNPNFSLYEAIRNDQVNNDHRQEIIRLLKERMIKERQWKIEGKLLNRVKRCQQIDAWLDEYK